ncbi:hypothetical protein [Microbacterium sp. A94]|uniref:hypothetical protein n=1 Tax=Microbacterium sp. A94 TaxID=3450717 RepID=UPI003F425AA5
MNIFAAILACEIGFWVVLFGGLAARYLLRMKRLSTLLLLCVPLLDIALLSLIAWDLTVAGATADFAHGLGAVYLGFTVAFGHRVIHSVDVWFAHRFANGPAPTKLPARGRARVLHEWKDWGRMVLCAVIATVVLGGISWIVADPTRTAELTSWIWRVWLVTGVWFIGWPVWVSAASLVQPAGQEDETASERSL